MAYDHVHVWGLPIHYSTCQEIVMWIYCVRMMVETNPDCLAASDDGFNCYPIHALLSNPNIGNLHEILVYLLESESSSIRLVDGYDRSSNCLSNEGITVGKKNSWPEGDIKIFHTLV